MTETASATVARLLLVVLCLGGLGGCSGLTGKPAQWSARQDLPPAVELADVPFFPQTRYQCGPAALATVLNYSGLRQVGPTELQPQVYLPGRRGSLQVELLAASRRHGRLAYQLEANLDALLAELAAGHPVLVMQNLGFDWWPQWHYAVVVGYDLSARMMILRSGEERRRLIPIHTFDNTWRRAGRWALVVQAPPRMPASAQPLPYLQSVNALEPINPESAVVAYRQAVRRWPEQPLSWLGLGNLQYASGRYSQSVDTFQQALAVHPDDARLWNNLAYALDGAGCRQQVLQALRCGLRRQPESPLLLQSLDELRKDGIVESEQSIEDCPRLRRCPP
ncbi:PA2778 family cysteine peptidase [Marinobacterium arenosum]|uniref:PA2778 family cysteine peptidase n=1 Tax=Marinobacterium arenosum TaxID=2862496 RepID=UPI001C9607FF|nr:PA2778 family cysteine peptidase [Marinobacterium arenosum]MBY4675075.1 PA2778 family cysteine peptidase [Marinobacterium arenosum]